MQPAKREGLAEAHGNTEPVRSRQLGSSYKTAATQVGWSFGLGTFFLLTTTLLVQGDLSFVLPIYR